MPPELLFGAGGIGEGIVTHAWTTGPQTSELLSALKEFGLLHLDGAASYPPGLTWGSETLLGEAGAATKGFVIDSKVEVVTLGGGPRRAGSLTPERMRASMEKTLGLLGLERVHIYYSHGPDPVTPLAETARGFDELFRAGKFEKLGLCSYSATQVDKYIAICEKQGYVKPSYVQGEYSALRRGFEETLFPLLRRHGIKFYAFSPLAGGFLTGRVTVRDASSDLSQTRWGEAKAPIYLKIYDRPEIHSAMKELMQICAANGMTSTEASMRWIKHHSALGEGDGIILGASKIEHLKSNLDQISRSPLPELVLRAVEDMWEKVKLLMGEVSYDQVSGK